LPDAGAAAAVRRAAWTEAGLGVLVIAIVGALGTLSPPLHRHVHAAETSPEGAFVHIHDARGMAEVTILPGRPGRSEVRVRLMREDFSPLPAAAVTVRLTQPGEAPIVAEARRGAIGLWRAPGMVIPTGGVWSVVVTVETGQGDPLLLDAPIVIEP
jgi:copper transport protein